MTIFAQSERKLFSIQVSRTVLSPNSDGKKDFVFITLNDVADDLKYPSSWECEIVNSSGKRVFLYRSDMRLKRVTAGINNLFLPEDKNIRFLQIFDRLYWDGRSYKGGIVPDGIYFARVHIVDASSSKIWTKTSKKIEIDTQSPKITLSPRKSLLVNNADTSNSKLVLIQKSLSHTLGVNFTAQLFDFNYNLIYETKWKDELPSIANINWNDIASSFKDSSSRYIYRLKAEDEAGNSSVLEYKNLIVSNQYYKAGIASDRLSFSPNQDGRIDYIHFEVYNMNSNGIKMNSGVYTPYLFQISSEEDGNVIYQKQGSGNLPQKIRWDGYNQNQELQSDGTYFARVLFNGKEESAIYAFQIDTSAESGSISVSQNTFVPDFDGKNEFIFAELDFDEKEIKQWSIALVLKPKLNQKETRVSNIKKTYKYFYGTSKPVNIAWDGYSDDGIEVSSFESFEFLFELIDRSGNRFIGSSTEMETGLLFQPIRKGSQNLVLRLPLQGYFLENGSLTTRGKNVIESVVSELDYYGLYKVSFEVHSSSIGKEEDNLVKTEKRARGMNRFLKKIWNKSSPYEYRGYGETELLNEKNESFYHYRNERIEVQLSL